MLYTIEVQYPGLQAAALFFYTTSHSLPSLLLGFVNHPRPPILAHSPPQHSHTLYSINSHASLFGKEQGISSSIYFLLKYHKFCSSDHPYRFQPLRSLPLRSPNVSRFKEVMQARLSMPKTRRSSRMPEKPLGERSLIPQQKMRSSYRMSMVISRSLSDVPRLPYRKPT